MRIDYIITCKICGEKNPLYLSVCKNCGTILRDRVPSIDLWKTISQLIESPNSAFVKIIRSEQKNFATLILAASMFKIYILFSIIVGLLGDFNFSFYEYMYHLPIAISIVLLFGILLKKANQKNKGMVRIRDIYACICYSFTPQLLGLFILFVLEFIIYGEQLFTFNPSPFLIKKNFAYTFLILEIGVLLWNVLLASKFLRFYFVRKVNAYIGTILVIVLLYLSMINFL